MGHLRGVYSNREGFNHGRFIIVKRVGYRAATGGGHHQVLRQRARMSGAAQEFLVAAGVLTSGTALVTFAAGYQRVDGHTLARTESCYLTACFQDGRSKLMPE